MKSTYEARGKERRPVAFSTLGTLRRSAGHQLTALKGNTSQKDLVANVGGTVSNCLESTSSRLDDESDDVAPHEETPDNPWRD